MKESLLSHKLLSRPESRVATVVGAGVQAREHLRLLPLVRDLDDIQICSLEFEHAERLARLHPKARAVRELEQAIRRSDIVCLATHSPTPAIDADWVRAGTHVSSVGYHPPLGELPVALARGHRLFVETLDAFAAPPVGCAELNDIRSSNAATLVDRVARQLGLTRRGAEPMKTVQMTLDPVRVYATGAARGDRARAYRSARTAPS